MFEFQGILDLFLEPFSSISIMVTMNLFDQLVNATCNSVVDD